MKLRAKIFLILSLAILLMLLSVFWIIYTRLSHEFIAAQNEDAFNQMDISLGILDRDIDSFSVKLNDWAQWDDSYQFVEDQNQEFITSNLNDETIQSLGLDFICYLDRDGHIVYEKQAPVAEGDDNIVLSGQYLQEHVRLSEEHTTLAGLMEVDGNMFLLAARPILKSTGAGNPNGTLYFGKHIHQNFFEQIGVISGVQFSIRSADLMRDTSSENSNVLSQISEEGQGTIRIDDQKKVTVVRNTLDIFGIPTLAARLQYDGHIIARGLDSSFLFGKAVVIVSIVFVVVVFLLTEWLVLRKLLRLDTEVKRVTDLKDVSARVAMEGSDEFASLGDGINKMLESLQSLVERTTQSESRFDVIANLAPVMIWMTNAKGEYTYLNKSAKEFIARVAGKNNWGECIYIEDLGMRKALMEEAQAANRAFRLEYRVQKKSGGYIWVSESAVPHISMDGKLIGYLGVVVDIHQEKEILIQSKAFTHEIEEMNEIFMSREEKMLELKEEVKRLKKIQEEKI